MNGNEWMDWLDNNKLPIDLWVKTFLDYLEISWAPFFAMLEKYNSVVGNYMEWIASLLSPLAWLAGFTLVGLWFTRSVLASCFVVLCGLLTINLKLWDIAFETLLLWFVGFIGSLILGLLLGLFFARIRILRHFILTTANYKLAVPMIIFLVPVFLLFKSGLLVQLLSIVLVGSLVCAVKILQGFETLPPQLQGLGNAYGATSRQRFYKIELPYVLKGRRNFIADVAMAAWSMSILSGLVGIHGLGHKLIGALLVNQELLTINLSIVIILLSLCLYRISRGRGYANVTPSLLIDEKGVFHE